MASVDSSEEVVESNTSCVKTYMAILSAHLHMLIVVPTPTTTTHRAPPRMWPCPLVCSPLASC
eukprot:722630-Amphidinium_carterae.1